jgi:hypothetical protein
MQGTIEGNEAPSAVDDERWQPSEPGRRVGTTQRRVIAALVVVVLATVAVLGFRSGSSDKDEDVGRASGTQAAPATTAATTPPPTAAPTTAQPANQAPAVPAEPAAVTPEPEPEAQSDSLEDGRHAVYLTDIDTSAPTLEFDLIQWLTDHAADEYVEAHPDEYAGIYAEDEEEYGYPYDYLVVNENPRLRTLPVAADAQTRVLQTDDDQYSAHDIPFAELPDYFSRHDMQFENRISYSVFWLTVHDGEIVALDEQFQS